LRPHHTTLNAPISALRLINLVVSAIFDAHADSRYLRISVARMRMLNARYRQLLQVRCRNVTGGSPPSATMHVAAHQTKDSQSNQGNTVILLF
jgi:hypothetical protein